MPKKYIVTLNEEERASLEKMVNSGTAPARKLTRARILLKADSADARAGCSDQAISEALDVGLSTICRVRQRFVEEGFDVALNSRRPGRHYKRKLDGQQEAHLIAIVCSHPPQGQHRWTLRLLANRMIELNLIDAVSYETVRQVLKKTNLSRGSSSSGAYLRSRMRSSYAEWRMCWKSIHVLMMSTIR